MLQHDSIVGTAAQDFWFCFRLGRLHLNAGGLCPIRARAIMEYWQIDELLLGNKANLCYFCSFNSAFLSGKHEQHQHHTNTCPRYG